jgi:hypothetical protein
MRAAEIFLTETDHNDEYLVMTSRCHAIHAQAATVVAQSDVRDEA